MTNLAKRIAAAMLMTGLVIGATAASSHADASADGPRITADTSWSY